MEESLSTPKQWAKISKKFPGRTQHHIKNRFICVSSKELNCTREEIREMMKNDNILGFIFEAWNYLMLEKQETSGNTMSLYDQSFYKKEEAQNVFAEEKFDRFVFEENEKLSENEKNLFNADDFMDLDILS